MNELLIKEPGYIEYDTNMIITYSYDENGKTIFNHIFRKDQFIRKQKLEKINENNE